MRLQSVHHAVVAALTAQLGPLAELNSMAVPWFSATFEGVRHTLRFAAVAPELLDALDTLDLVLPHPDHVIVSIGAEWDDGRTRIDVLTVACN